MRTISSIFALSNIVPVLTTFDSSLIFCFYQLICLRDLILSKTQADDVEQSTNTSLKRDAVVLESSRWTDGIIPYILDGSLGK